MGNSSTLCKVGCWLALFGALNWGLVGIGSFMGVNLNIVNLFLGNWVALENLVYVLIGLAAVMKLVKCSKAGGAPAPAPAPTPGAPM